MADWKGGNSAKKADWRGGASAPPGKATGRAWKTGDAPPPGGGFRKFAAIIVGMLLLGVLGGIVWWMLLPKVAPKPCLVLLAANPADDCLKLDVPLDYYGWQGCKTLAEQAKERAAKEQKGNWGTFAPHVATADDGNPRAIPSTETELADWANSLRNFDPLVIYVGAHGGTGPDGPFVFANGRTRLPLKTLLGTLSTAPLKDKKKVLLLDPGRLPPDVRHGQLIDDFAAKVATLNKEISDCPNLLVIVGTSANETGWQSEELLGTPLALALAEALNGAEGVTTDDDLITGLEIFTFIKKRVTEWTRENRPAVSTPYLLPKGTPGEERAKGITVAVKPSTPAAAKPPVTTLEYAELLKAAQRMDELAKQSPERYQPRLWRRYRELFLRYQEALRAQETATAKKLKASLDSLEETFKARQLPAFESAANSIAMYRALGGKVADASAIPPDWQGDAPTTPPPADPAVKLAILEAALRRFTVDDNVSPAELKRKLASAGMLATLYDADQRPVEAHLPLMAREYFDKLSPQSAIPKSLFTTARQRGAFENALFGSGASEAVTDAATYPELFFAWHAASTADLDAIRRSAEDALFSTDSAIHGENTKAATAAGEKFSATRSSAVRKALTLRDRTWADMSYLEDWHLRSHSKLRGDLSNLAAGLHELNARLASDSTTAATAAASLETADAQQWMRHEWKWTEIFRSYLNAQDANATLQGQWEPKQHLLATPLAPAEQRVKMLRDGRDISARLLAGAGKQATGLAAAIANSSNTGHAWMRAKGALTLLGKAVIDANCKANVALVSFEKIDADIANALTFTDNANSIGAALAAHFAQLAKPVPLTDTVNPAAETASRISTAYDADEALEPATVNQRLRWHKALTMLGERACADRWYDEREQPWFAKQALRYFNDADAVVKGLPVKLPADQAKNREALLANRKLQVTSSIDRLKWTSELRRTVSFNVSVPADYPASGTAVAVRGFTKAAPLKARDAAEERDRAAVPIAAGQSATFNATLDVGVAERLDAQCFLAGTVWFRGQRPTAELPVYVMRRPELVFQDPLPKATEKDVAFAVRAAPDLDLGEIVVILDYSGSMREGLDGVSYAKDDAYRTKPSKFRMALDSLKPVLADLPPDTRLKIRVFSEKVDDPETAPASRVVFGDFEKERTRWQRSNVQPLNDVMRLLEDLRPSRFTPLVKSILTSAKEDFSSDRSRTKTIVVLTDGIDQEGQELPSLETMTLKSRELSDKFVNSDIQLLVITFALTDKERTLGRELFKALPQHRNPGEVFESANQDKLRENLRDALRPKLKLTEAGKALAELPRSGWPARLREDGADNRETLVWTPSLKVPATQRLTAMPYPSAQTQEREVRVEEGDRTLLEIAKVGDKTVVRRDLYADFFTADKRRERADKQWVLTVPTTTVDDRSEPLSLRGLALLEKVPGHRSGVSDEKETLASTRPGFLWWNVQASDKDTKLGTVTIKKQYAYAAPAYDLRAENWPREAGGFAVPTITATMLEQSPAVKSVTLNLGEPMQKAVTTDGDEVELRPSIEEHRFDATGETLSFLVVRCVHAKEKPVLLRLASPAVRHHAEHRWYKKADAYTALFGPFTAEDFKTLAPKLDLIAVSPVTANAANAIALTAPRPTPGVRLEQDYKPQLSAPAEKK